MGDVCEVELSEVGVDGANSVVDDGGEPTQSRIVAKAATPVGVDGDNADDVDWVPQSSGPRCCGCSDACLNTAIPFIGNVLEWFDFSVFGYMTSFLSEAFFPSVDPVAATMSTFTVFAGAFLMRPVGGLIFGHIGDTIGRKRALLSSIILMVSVYDDGGGGRGARVHALLIHTFLLWPPCRRRSGGGFGGESGGDNGCGGGGVLWGWWPCEPAVTQPGTQWSSQLESR